MTARREIVAEVRLLLSAGESPARIAERLGVQPDSVARALARAQRPDLARPFWTTSNRRRGLVK